MGEIKRRKLLEPSFGQPSPPIVTILEKDRFEYALADELFKNLRSQYKLAFYVLVEQEDFQGYGVFWCTFNKRGKICVGSLLAPHPECKKNKTEFETWFQVHRQYVNDRVAHHARSILKKNSVVIAYGDHIATKKKPRGF